MMGERILKFTAYVSEIVKGKGFFYFIRKALYFIIGQLLGFLLYPVCAILNIKFLPVCISNIGHLAGELDCYIKEGLLGLRPKYNSIVLATPKKVANRYLLKYWKKYVYVIENPILCFLLKPLLRSKLLRYNLEKYFCGDYLKVVSPEIQKRYYGRPPVLFLTDFDRARGWEALRKLGLPANSWFVCVHCREGGNLSYKEGQSLRDVDVNNYFHAIEEITRRGGWVLRMGDVSMKPIPSMKNVIDYAHLEIKSDWMDVFLCASCKFFLGSNSGLAALASVFGVRCVATNISGPVSAVLSYGPEDISIPKFIWFEKEKRYLNFKEILSSPIGNFREDSLFKSYGIKTIENSPEDIKEVTIEMLDKLDGKLVYTHEDQVLQERFKLLMNPIHFSYGAMSRVGRDFLRKYKHLL